MSAESPRQEYIAARYGRSVGCLKRGLMVVIVQRRARAVILHSMVSGFSRFENHKVIERKAGGNKLTNDQ